jgi:diguanylate cyclase (GGDEF)-like protein
MRVSAGEVAFAGQRFKRKTFVALVLSAVIPYLLLAYVVHVHVLPALDADAHRGLIVASQVVLFLLGVLIAVGAYVIWGIASAVTRSPEVARGSERAPSPSLGSDEIGALMQSFSRMLSTIETQAQEINSFAARLDAAYRELEGTNLRLKEFSFKDDVTGLYNRRFFSIRLEEEISRYRRFNHPVSVVLLDVDDFKTVNDEMGHAAGDHALRDIAQILRTHSRGINVIARYGGDEFAVLLVETSKAGALLYADRIRQVVSTYAFAHGGRITASFGVASLPEDRAASPPELVRLADDALYAAKRGGRDRVIGYEPPASDELVAPGRR